MSKLLFLTDYADDEVINSCLKKGKKNAFSRAGNLYSKKVIDAFFKSDINFDVLSAPNFGSFPNNNNNLFINCAKKTSKNLYYIDYCNLFGLRNISRYHNLKKVYKKMQSSNYTHVIVSEIHSPYLKLCKYIKKSNPNIVVSLIVQDLPEYMDLSNKKRPFYKAAKRIDLKVINKLYKYVDNYILLTEKMIDYLPHKKYIVSNGLIGNPEITGFDLVKGSVCYAGTLNKSFGVDVLIKAFKNYSAKDLTLLIAGDGEMKNDVVLAANNNHNIKYLGVLNETELSRVYAKSMCFVNPRLDFGSFSDVSFPSKVINYLQYCKPIVSYKMSCYGDKYDGVIDFADEYTPESLLNKIIEINNLSKEKYFLKVQEIKRFVLKNNYVDEINKWLLFINYW